LVFCIQPLKAVLQSTFGDSTFREHQQLPKFFVAAFETMDQKTVWLSPFAHIAVQRKKKHLWLMSLGGLSFF
jgi:hypothetical protein